MRTSPLSGHWKANVPSNQTGLWAFFALISQWHLEQWTDVCFPPFPLSPPRLFLQEQSLVARQPGARLGCRISELGPPESVSP